VLIFDITKLFSRRLFKDQISYSRNNIHQGDQRRFIPNFYDEKDDKGADYHTVVSTIENC
jgi:hypothetical protein